MDKKISIAIAIGAVGLSFLPIWRQGSFNRETGGLNLWQWLNHISQIEENEPFGHPHIPYLEARDRARNAWLVK